MYVGKWLLTRDRLLYSLVELIVLNIGLQAGILDTRTFSMFVLHALVLTFMVSSYVYGKFLLT